jgi:Tfp pilus assembly protein PilV
MRTTTRRRQRGTSLFEALVAFLVLSLGMIAIARTEGTLQSDVELARERSEACRLAQQELEQLRGLRPFTAIASASRSVEAFAVHYLVTREITPMTLANAKAASIGVAWSDRSGALQRITLHSILDGTDAALSGAFTLALPAAVAAPPR